MRKRSSDFNGAADQQLLWYLRNSPDIALVSVRHTSALDTSEASATAHWHNVGTTTLRQVFENPLEELRTYIIEFVDGDEAQLFKFGTDADHTVGWIITLDDGGVIENPGEHLGADQDDDPADAGIRLLEPITQTEFAAMELVVAELWVAVEDATLTKTQQAQIVAMAELIKAEQLASIPGETQRWKLVGTVGGALRYLRKDLPKEALSWVGLIELFKKLDWTTIAGELPGL